MDEPYLQLLQKKINRERKARIVAEKLLEEKSLELFEAKRLIEDSAEKIKHQAKLDSQLLAYQTQMENHLLYYSQLFLKQEPTPSILNHLVEQLIDNKYVSSCCIFIQTDSDTSLEGLYQAGNIDLWSFHSNLNIQTKYWDHKNKILWLSLTHNHQIIGHFAAQISSTSASLKTLQQHLILFKELLCSALGRKISMNNAISAQKRAENSERSTRDFLAMINHELRTPLNGLLGAAELLADTSLSSEQKKLLDTLNNSGELLRAIINDLLDYSKISAGMLELIIKPFNPHQIINSLADIMRYQAQEKQLLLTLVIDDTVPNCLLGDEDRIKQIFVNLINNAIKFTSRGSIILNTTWREDKLIFQVKDTGIGITEGQQLKLFKPFSQVDISSQRIHEGTGLGLAICKQLCELMSGEIKLISIPEQGSTFTVILPLKLCDTPLDISQQTIKPTQLSSQKKVLVVEDLATNQMIIKLMLTKLGIEPKIVNNGQEAIDIISNTSFDIILMDCRMPVMDGYTATRLLRNNGYTKPIIALTAGTTTTEREECLTSGMDDILCKPYQRAELHKMLIKWV
ncbi:ATP-binding protein [Photobacterium damselae]|uniref:ATP-binding protein n=1 Tax=Photobacterium damselae TaxID=38293 RepID=UPI0035A943E9